MTGSEYAAQDALRLLENCRSSLERSRQRIASNQRTMARAAEALLRADATLREHCPLSLPSPDTKRPLRASPAQPGCAAASSPVTNIAPFATAVGAAINGGSNR